MKKSERNLKLFELQQDDDEIETRDLDMRQRTLTRARIFFFFDFVFICLFFRFASTVCKHIHVKNKTSPEKETSRGVSSLNSS
jgi:hypothetical protein